MEFLSAIVITKYYYRSFLLCIAGVEVVVVCVCMCVWCVCGIWKVAFIGRSSSSCWRGSRCRHGLRPLASSCPPSARPSPTLPKTA